MSLIDEHATASVLAQLSDGLADAVEQAAAWTVTVNGRRRLPATGVVWSDPSFVVTADHVLERDHEITVVLSDGRTVRATLAGRDGGADVALLKLETPASTAAPFAPVGSLKPGHLVLGIGRPGGASQASFGAVSAVGGRWRTARGGVLDAYLKADLALQPGFSGGPVIDAQGRLVGLLSSGLAGPDAVAIPAETLRQVVDGILAGGPRRRGYLGVSAQAVALQASLRQRLDVSQETGLLLLGVLPDGPADRAGLLVGDIVLSIGGRAATDGEALQMALGPDTVNSQVALQVLRGGTRQAVTATPIARPDDE